MEPAAATAESGARAGAALELFIRRRSSLLRAARRYSLCMDDAEDALQRALVIALTKAPTIDGVRLDAWMNVVTRREAQAVRKGRERQLGVARFADSDRQSSDPFEWLACERPGPLEAATRHERVAEAAALLAALKADERTAIVLQAEGYSYAEICALRGWTYTKVNRCLAEGRAKLRSRRAEVAEAGS